MSALSLEGNIATMFPGGHIRIVLAMEAQPKDDLMESLGFLLPSGLCCNNLAPFLRWGQSLSGLGRHSLLHFLFHRSPPLLLAVLITFIRIGGHLKPPPVPKSSP